MGRFFHEYEYYSIETQKVEVKKFEIDEIEFCLYHKKKKSPWLCRYKSYVSYWYINRKMFTSITALKGWNPKSLI